MIERHFEAENTKSRALYSGCEAYRYLLARVWADEDPTVLYIMLNPSTATEERNDPTIERCERRARAMGFGGFTICNLFAWRATKPADLKAALDPIGPDNDAVLARAAADSDTIICAWGVHGSHLDRGPRLARSLHEQGCPLRAFGFTKDNHPRHPLYLPYSAALQDWQLDPAGT